MKGDPRRKKGLIKKIRRCIFKVTDIIEDEKTGKRKLSKARCCGKSTEENRWYCPIHHRYVSDAYADIGDVY